MRVRARHLLGMVTLNGGIRNGLENHRMLTEEAERSPRSTRRWRPCCTPTPGSRSPWSASATGARVGRAGDRAACPRTRRRRSAVGRIRSTAWAWRSRAGRRRRPRRSTGPAALLAEVEPVSAAAQSISFALMGRLCTGGGGAAARGDPRAGGGGPREPLARHPALVPAADRRRRLPARRLGRGRGRDRGRGRERRGLRPARPALDRARSSGRASTPPAAANTAAREDAHRGVEIAEPVAYGSVRLWSMACLGFLELGLGRADRGDRAARAGRGLAGCPASRTR